VLAGLVAVGSDIGATSRPFVSLANAETGEIVARTLAFEDAFRGGTRVAMGDVDGNGTYEVLAASGPGRVGEIRVFEQVVAGSSVSLRELIAYRTIPFGAGYRAGVDVAAGDIDGNDRADIVAAASRGRGVVRAFLSTAAADPVADAPVLTIEAFDRRFNGGASVAVADLGTFSGGQLTNAAAADGKVEILVGSGAGMRAIVKAYDISRPEAPRVADSIEPFTAALKGGVSVAAGRYDADVIDDVIVRAGRGGGGATEIYSGTVAAAANAKLATFAAFSGLPRPNAPVFTAGVDRNGDGRFDAFTASQGDPRATALASLSQAGVRSGTFTTVSGPARVAAPLLDYRFTTTSTGLQYRVLAEGSGPTPIAGQRVTAHYTGWLTDGSKFDSSRDRGEPFSFTLGRGQVIAGWDEAIATMRVGERRTLVIPANLAYGSAGRPGIPPNSTLVFDVALLGIG